MSRAPQDNSDAQRNSEYLAAWNATMKLLREGQSFSGRERNCVFLNCGLDSPFANISAVSGLDFLDDARVIAMVDWDQDGDLDCWLHNRTGPRLRLMQNQTVGEFNDTNYLAIRLKGTASNRDAIGARVEVLFQEAATPRMTKTLYAGDAFLSQSSKWLHFGLGQDTVANVRAVRVRWPGGKSEDFFVKGPRCLLTEGSGKAISFDGARRVTLAPAEQVVLPPENTFRIPLVNRPPIPILNVRSASDARLEQLQFSSRPTLLVLWASWCDTCQYELKSLSKQERTFDVLAVAVDDVASEKPTRRTITQVSDDWNLNFPIYSATPELLDKLALIGRVALNRSAQFAVPTSFLIDQQGRVAAIYRGAATPSDVASDVAALDLSLAQRRDRAIPFAGKWTTPPNRLLMRPVANLFRDRGYTEDYSRFIKLEIDDVKALRAAATTDTERAKYDRHWSGANFNIAFAHEQQREFQEAVDFYRQGLSVFPHDARAWQRLASCLGQLGQQVEAIAALQTGIQSVDDADLRLDLANLMREQGDLTGAWIQLDAAITRSPSSARALFHRGTLLASQGKLDEAEKALRQAVAADPKHFESLLNLGALLASNGESKDAIRFLQRAVQARTNHVNAKLNLAKALLSENKTELARQQLTEVLSLEPSNAQARLGLAQIASANKQPAELRDQLQAAIRANPQDTASKLRLAWLLATCPDKEVKDARRALQIASELNQQAQGQHPIVLDTLAAAHAATGDFESAIAAATKAVDMLLDAQQEKLSQEVRGRLRLYTQQQAYVQP